MLEKTAWFSERCKELRVKDEFKPGLSHLPSNFGQVSYYRRPRLFLAQLEIRSLRLGANWIMCAEVPYKQQKYYKQ